MGMISNHIQGRKADTEVEDGDTRKKAVSGNLSMETKDVSSYRNPGSPSGNQFRGDIKDRRPAEIFRTDFITAMKVADNQTLPVGKHFELADTWRQEWEKGVQVPVNPQALPKISFRKKDLLIHGKRYDAFSLPKTKITVHSPELVHTNEKTTGCLYDLDDLDVSWLQAVRLGSKRGAHIDECMMERTMALFERKCFEKMAHAVATKKGLSIEYDDSTTCDVCLSPDTEECNEIVFCDACNMCVHQACYGIPEIPAGTWLCRPCSRGVLSPPCVICPNTGGAMKRVKNSFEWIHVICAWWVPEVKIEDTENVEKMTIDKIPTSRKNLCCNLCRQKVGACVQCSVKRCVAAYHVTCAVKEGLEMKTVMLQESNDVQHISYCKRHCIAHPTEKSTQRATDKLENQRLHELQKLQEEFFKLVDLRSSARELRLNRNITAKLFSYWVLKRKANGNRPLVPLTTEQQEKLSGKQGIFLIREQINVEMERYALLRQDLERLRNLCYLIIRRERTKREIHKASQDVFYKQDEILNAETSSLNDGDFNMLISGSELMKFTKFPHYASDGPPYADHLKEIEIQECDPVAINGIAVEQGMSNAKCIMDASEKVLYSTQMPNFNCYENHELEIPLEENSNKLSSTGEVKGPFTEKELDGGEINKKSNRTVKSVPEATLNSVDHRTLTTDVEYGSDGSLNGRNAYLQLREGNADMSEDGGEGNNLSEFMEELENIKVSSGGTEAENITAVREAFTNGKIDENLSANDGEESSGVNNSFNYSMRFLSKYNALHGVSAQRFVNEPELAPSYSKENGDCSFKLDIPCEHKGPMSSFKRSTQYSLGDSPVVKRGRRHELSKVIRSRRILRNSTKMKEAFVNSFDAYKHDKLGEQLSNEGPFSDGIKYLYGTRRENKHLMNACKYHTLSNCDSFSDSKVNYKQESSFTKTEGKQKKIVTSAESACESDISKCFQGPEGSNQTTDALTSETDSIGTLEPDKNCTQSDSSTSPTIESSDCSIESIQNVKDKNRDNLKREKSKFLQPGLDQSVHIVSNIENLNEVNEKCREQADLSILRQRNSSSGFEGFQINIAKMIAYKNRPNYLIPCVDEALNDGYDKKTYPNQNPSNQESGVLKEISTDSFRSFEVDMKASVVDEDIPNSKALQEKNSSERIGDSLEDFDICNESSTMCNEAVNDNNSKLSSVTKNSNKWANNSIESQTEVYAIKCNDNIVPQSSSVNFDLNLKRLREETSTNKRIFDAFNFSDATRNPIVLLNEVTNLNEAKTHCNLNGLHESPRKYKKSNDIPSPAFPHSVIDDLIACPQRLTRGRTQLMMMGHNEDTSSFKRPRKRRKTIGGNGEEGDLVIALSEPEPLVEKFQLQRLTRRRVRSLGCMKSNLPNLQHINDLKKAQSPFPPKIDSSKLNPGSSKSGQVGSIDQACNANNVSEFIVSPTRLTRARVRLLGLGKHNEDLVLV